MSKEELADISSLIKPGVYQHYRGGKYRVHTAGYLEANLEKMVIYTQLQNDGSPGITFVRPYTEFVQVVDNNGESVPRFSFLG